MTDAPPDLDPPRVRGLVFDLDGTLVDSYRAIAASLNHARAGFGLPPLQTAEVRRSVGHGLEVLIADLVGSERVDAGVRLFRQRYAEVYAAMTDVLPGVAETLRELSAAGLRMSVASNKPARFGVPILRELGLLEHFACVLGPDVTGATKPDPRMIHGCLTGMGLSADAACYVGDMVLDVESAARAGIAVALVAGGSSEIGELRATGHPVLERFSELTHLLRPAA